MRLEACKDIGELVQFLKLDYANNLYFFTYLNEDLFKLEEIISIGRINGEIAVAVLTTPIHFSISSVKVEYIDDICEHISFIESVHIVGRSDYIDKILSSCKTSEREKNSYRLCQLSSAVFCDSLQAAAQASQQDLYDLIQFYAANGMLFSAQDRLAGILKWGRAYYIRKNHEIISCALTTTETEEAAMIGAVFTEPEHRENGYASACLFAICRDLISLGKRPYLFYGSENFLLANLYEDMGFRKISDWTLATRII